MTVAELIEILETQEPYGEVFISVEGRKYPASRVLFPIGWEEPDYSVVISDN